MSPSGKSTRAKRSRVAAARPAAKPSRQPARPARAPAKPARKPTRAAEALRESEAKFRMLVGEATDGITITDSEWRFLEVNPSFCELVGYTREELSGMSVRDIGVREDLEREQLRVEDLAAGRKILTQRTLRRKDGTVLAVEIGARSLPDGTVLSVVRDITERRKAEQALVSSEARYRALHDSLMDAFVIVARDGRILEFNEPYRAMLGYESGELLARTYMDLTPERWHALEVEVVEKEILPRGHSVVYEKEYRRKDGTVFPVELRAMLLPDAAGAPTRMWALVRDISARKQAEADLRESEERFRGVFHSDLLGIVFGAAGGTFVDANEYFLRLTGYTREDLLAGQVREDVIFSPEELARARENPRWNRDTGVALPFESEFVRKDGTRVPVLTGAAFLEPERRFAVGFALDLTELKSAQRRLSDSERHLEKSQELAHVGTWTAGAGTTTATLSDEMASILGFPEGTRTIELSRFLERVHPDDRERIGRDLRGALERPASMRYEHRVVWSDGSVRFLETVSEPGLDEAGRFTNLLGVTQDVTERRNTARRLAESEYYLERAQQLAHVGTWDADLATMTAKFSDELLRIHGLPAGLKQVPFADFIASIHPDDRAAVQQAIREEIARPGQRNFEHRIVRPDGSVRVVAATSESVVDASGRPQRIIGSVQDVTERRLLELQLREAQRLESIGRLAGGVAHDFNNLLTVILGFTETLLEGLPAGDERRASAEQVRSAGRRAAELTQQLLAFGRRQVLRTRVFDLNEVLAELRDIIRRLVGEQVELGISTDTVPCLARADQGQIEQVIVNLALNARDAMPAGGRLDISVRNVDLAADGKGGLAGRCLQLTVSDTGTGMSPEVRAQIFEPFFTTKDLGQGTGLGLATVHGVVLQTGGRIEVSSVPGKGSTFRVFLPCAAGVAGAQEAASVPAPSESRGEETVLLVEDESSVREFIAGALRRGGYQVVAAADGDEAIDAAHRHAGVIHLLVTDLVMPGMTGRELARYLTHERPGLRVLFISGYSDQRSESRAGEGVAEAFMQKPFTAATLARQVRQVLDAPGP